MDLRMQMDAKSGELKIESMSENAKGKTKMRLRCAW